MFSTMTHPTTPSLSLQEVMDEEYARKLQEELNCDVYESVDDFVPAETKLENDTEKPVNGMEKAEVDEDMLMALRLQAEFDQEYNQEVRQRTSEQQASKVTTSYSNFLSTDDITYHLEEDHRAPRLYSAADCGSDDEEEDEEDEEDEYEAFMPQTHNKAFVKPGGRAAAAMLVTKHDARVCGARNAMALDSNLGLDTGDMSKALPTAVYNSLTQHAKSAEHRRVRTHGKEDRETREGVMDPVTRIILFKMINNALFDEMSGIISTGKEACVYRALSHANVDADARHFAVKVFKTNLNEFKQRDEYIKGDIRYSRVNRKNLIPAWCEKEEENLKRMRAHGIPCPEVLRRKKHVLLMTFIGNESSGKAAPQLRVAVKKLSELKLREVYLQCIRQMRVLFSDCRLVHADLSEYNMLYFKGVLYFIDVAQAVEYEHPNSLVFLRRDCASVTQFFYKSGLKNVMSIRELFMYVTDRNITAANEEEYLAEMQRTCKHRDGPDAESDAVFMQSFIPRHLGEISEETALQEIEAAKQGDTEDVFHQQLTGMLRDLSGASCTPVLLHKDAEEANITPATEEEISAAKEKQRTQRKEHKKKVKAEQRERRAQRAAETS